VSLQKKKGQLVVSVVGTQDNHFEVHRHISMNRERESEQERERVAALSLVVGEGKGGSRTMEIGPIRNQNLIFPPLANVL